MSTQVPQLESDHDIAYVPKKVCDRRQASLEDEFRDSDAHGTARRSVSCLVI